MIKKQDITFDWLKRYTGTNPNEFGDWILLTNFHNYVEKFSMKFDLKINGIGGPMTSAINSGGLSIINFGIGSANAATIMDLLSAINPKAVLFLGKCGGLKKRINIGDFVLPIGATINMDGTAVYQAIAAVFIAQTFGLDLSITAQLGIIVTATLASIGAAAVPSAGIIVLVIVLAQAGIPEAGLALIFAVDRPLDMCRTVVNITGDATVSMIVDKIVSKK